MRCWKHSIGDNSKPPEQRYWASDRDFRGRSQLGVSPSESATSSRNRFQLRAASTTKPQNQAQYQAQDLTKHARDRSGWVSSSRSDFLFLGRQRRGAHRRKPKVPAGRATKELQEIGHFTRFRAAATLPAERSSPVPCREYSCVRFYSGRCYPVV